MRQFAYLSTEDPNQALTELAAGPDVHLLGGGTNLVDLMKLRVVQPGRLVDVSRLPFQDIEPAEDGGLLIGGAVRNSDLAAHPLVRQGFPAIAQALLAGASGQLRNQATVAGNLMQRTRCAYFMDVDKPCNKREPGSGCSARTGEHHNHAILGASPACIATSPSDLAVALAAFDTSVELLTSEGPRVVPLAEFRRLPGEHPEQETTVDGVITGIRVPGSSLAPRARYRKVRERASYAFAIASVAAAISVEAGLVTDCRIAWGAVAHIPWRARQAEQYLIGRPADRDTFATAVEIELQDAEPLPGNAYKTRLIGNLTVDMLVDLAGREEAR